jgi:class I fructose-bisphosphate aldolase
MNTPRVKEILSWYGSDNPGTLTNLALADRVKHVVQCCFNGRRVVIFSGGPASSDDTVYQEVTSIRQGGGFGSIMGRNSFQRKKEQALQFLGKIISIYGS